MSATQPAPNLESAPPRSLPAGACSGLPLSQLRARAIIASDLYREGKIRRHECFRLEMDACMGRDTGPIRYEENTDYNELQ